MDRADGVVLPVELPAEAVHDQIVLVRLHGQPLAIVHIEKSPGTETGDDLMIAAWRAASDAVIAHITACRCLPAPEDHEELSLMLRCDDGGRGGSCEGSASRPAGKATVIVCTAGDDEDTLARCLRSLVALEAENFEIVVVDNRPSRPATRALVERFVSPVRLRYVAESRPGLAGARNAGVAAAAGAEFLAFTDDDVVVDPAWLSWLLEPFRRRGVDAVTGLVLPLHLQSRAEKRFEHYAGFGKGVHAESYDLAEHAARERFLYPYWGGMFGSGNSMAFRREALTAVGGFDPALGAGTPTGGGEDLAAFTDVILAGGQISYQPRSVCWHEHRGDEQALQAQIRNYGIGLTAVLWRYLMRDRRFSATLVRSVPAILRLARRRSEEREADALPADLARLELRGRLLGPWRYLVSSRRVRGVGRADAAHRVPGERRRAARREGAAGQLSGERRPGMDQAGAQTRT
ncbi:MAG TPA: glycosyltransferase family 2 protein [Solirubrobacteraceae bacterium]|nr:glycosyltransferase family 2 protein [Solirubrobacteraceae bacterium]